MVVDQKCPSCKKSLHADGNGIVTCINSKCSYYAPGVYGTTIPNADGKTDQEKGEQDFALSLHRFLFPERYESVPTCEWDSETIEEIAQIVERKLKDNPAAKLQYIYKRHHE